MKEVVTGKWCSRLWCLDNVGIKNVEQPVIVTGAQGKLDAKYTLKNLLLGYHVLEELGFLRWQTLARRVKDIMHSEKKI